MWETLQLREVIKHEIDLACRALVRYVLEPRLVLLRYVVLVFDHLIESHVMSCVGDDHGRLEH